MEREHPGMTYQGNREFFLLILDHFIEKLGWNMHSALDIAVLYEAKMLIISEVDAPPCCSLCRTTKAKNLTKVSKGHICPECVEEIKI